MVFEKVSACMIEMFLALERLNPASDRKFSDLNLNDSGTTYFL